MEKSGPADRGGASEDPISDDLLASELALYDLGDDIQLVQKLSVECARELNRPIITEAALNRVRQKLGDIAGRCVTLKKNLQDGLCDISSMGRELNWMHAKKRSMEEEKVEAKANPPDKKRRILRLAPANPPTEEKTDPPRKPEQRHRVVNIPPKNGLFYTVREATEILLRIPDKRCANAVLSDWTNKNRLKCHKSTVYRAIKMAKETGILPTPNKLGRDARGNARHSTGRGVEKRDVLAVAIPDSAVTMDTEKRTTEESKMEEASERDPTTNPVTSQGGSIVGGNLVSASATGTGTENPNSDDDDDDNDDETVTEGE